MPSSNVFPSRPDLMYLGSRFPVAVLAAAAFAAVVPGPSWVLLAAAEALVLALLVVDGARAPRPANLNPRRRLPGVVRVGQKAPVVVSLHNPTGRRLEVAVADATPPSLQREPVRHREVLAPGGWSELVAELQPLRRGRHQIGPLTIRTAGPLGIGGRQATLPSIDQVKVYPPLHGRAEVELRLRRARVLQAGKRSAAFRGGGSDFDSLRDYRPDDELRRINWMATARAVRPIANEFREEHNQQVILLLDVSRTMATQVQGVSRFEHALDAVIAVAELATRVGDQVGVAAFGSRVVASLEPRLDAANYRSAFASVLARHRRRSFLLLLTELTEESVLEPLYRALPILLERHLVTVGAVRDPDVDAMATARPASSEAAFEKAAASGYLAWRDRAAKRLLRLGAATVDSPPGVLAGRLADEYLRVKALGRL